MRIGIVQGRIVLSRGVEELKGTRFLVVEPVTAENLEANNSLGGGKALIAVDELGVHTGQLVAFTEGREASNPFWPEQVPVDAYCAMIIDSVDVESPNNIEVRK